jgi:hypothetical protein
MNALFEPSTQLSEALPFAVRIAAAGLSVVVTGAIAAAVVMGLAGGGSLPY